MPAQHGQRIAAIVERIDVVGLQRQRAIVARQGRGAAAQTFQRIAAIVMGDGIVAALRQYFVEIFQRLFMALERVEDDAVIRQHVRRARLRFQRGRNQTERFRRVALLVAEHATQMQGVEMLRVGGQRRAVERVRLDEAPLAVQGQRLLDATRRIRARSGVLGHSF